MKYILRFSVVLLIGLLLSCGSSQNNSKEINELLKSDFSIELNKTDVIVTDSIELAIKNLTLSRAMRLR